MLIPTLFVAAVAIALVAFAYSRGDGTHIEGLRVSANQLIAIIPLLVFAFVVAGMTQVLVPHEIVSKWVGDESGFRGIMIGTAGGALTFGGPFVSLPMAAAFLKAGAGLGTMIAYVTAWSTLNVGRVAMEVGILGWRFTAIRLLLSLALAPVLGLLAQAFFKGQG